MGVRDYPFVPREGEDRDPRRFPGHREVLKYLEDFANEFGICELVRFRTEVVFVGLELGKWRIRFRCENGAVHEETFDAVVVCVGNFSLPRVAEIPGIFQKVLQFNPIVLLFIYDLVSNLLIDRIGILLFLL